MSTDEIKHIVYGTLIAKLPTKEYLSMSSYKLMEITDAIVNQLIKEGIIKNVSSNL
jgi:hypothetical protein